MNCNTTHYRANSSSVPGDPTVGAEGLLPWTEPDVPAEGVFEYHYRSAVATTIYGGTSEVLRSLIAEQRLNLPRSRPKSS